MPAIPFATTQKALEELFRHPQNIVESNSVAVAHTEQTTERAKSTFRHRRADIPAGGTLLAQSAHCESSQQRQRLLYQAGIDTRVFGSDCSRVEADVLTAKDAAENIVAISAGSSI